MAWGNRTTSDAAHLPLIRQMRDALKGAEAELQRRCFISSEIQQAIASADAYLGDGGLEQNQTIPSSERARRLIRRV